MAGVQLLDLRDVTLTIEADEINADSHTSGGWGSIIPGIKRWSLSVEHLFVDANAQQQALRNALINSTLLAFDIRSKDSAGKEKFTGSGYILNWEFAGPQDDAAAISVEVKGDGALTPTTV